MPVLYDSASYTAVPVGSIIPVPYSGVPSGFLVCDGSSLPRNVYSSLFDVLGVSHGSASAEEFNLPDYRGTFLRGADNGVGRDSGRLLRTSMGEGGLSGDNVGTVQQHAFEGRTQPESIGASEIRVVNATVLYMIRFK